MGFLWWLLFPSGAPPPKKRGKKQHGGFSLRFSATKAGGAGQNKNGAGRPVALLGRCWWRVPSSATSRLCGAPGGYPNASPPAPCCASRPTRRTFGHGGSLRGTHFAHPFATCCFFNTKIKNWKPQFTSCKVRSVYNASGSLMSFLGPQTRRPCRPLPSPAISWERRYPIVDGRTPFCATEEALE